VIPETDGIYSGIDDAEYHADRNSLSVSGARVLLQAPAKFRHQLDHPQPSSGVFEFGSVAHKLVLGEGAEIVEVQADSWRTKAAQQARDEARAAGRIPILSGDLARARAMAEATLSHPIAGKLFEHGAAEQSIYATDQVTGVRLRGRADWLTETDGEPVIVDYKTSTTANPSELVRKFHSLGYHMQAAWYIDLCEAVGIPGPRFLFVVTEKDPPFLTTVVEYEQDAIAYARHLNRRAIDVYAECVERDEWPAYTDEIHVLSLPPWARSDADNIAAETLIAELEELL